MVEELIVQVDVRALRPEQLLHQHRDGAGAGELGGHVHRAPIGGGPEGGDGLHPVFIGVLRLVALGAHGQGVEAQSRQL